MAAAAAPLSDAHLKLLAVEACVSARPFVLPVLRARSATLTAETLLRLLLTFLPETLPPREYAPIVRAIADGNVPQDVEVAPSSITRLSKAAASKRADELHLLPLRSPKDRSGDSAPLIQFLFHRAHRIDSETGLQPLILELLFPFLEVSETLRLWVVSTVLPLLRFNYEFYQEKTPLVLDDVDIFDPLRAVNTFLSAIDHYCVGRDLRCLVGPWMYNRQRWKTGSGWQEVNEWLVRISQKDFDLATDVVDQWAGPGDVDLGGYAEHTPERGEVEVYAQAAMAVVYAAVDDAAVLDQSCLILSKVATLLRVNDLQIHNLELEPLSLDLGSIPGTSRTSLLRNMLLYPSNTLTVPSITTVRFLDAILASARTLTTLGRRLSVRQTVDVCLLSNEERQLAEFSMLIESLEHSKNPEWWRIREQFLWLRDWGSPDRTGHGLYWRVPLDVLEKETLQAMLLAKGSNALSSLSPPQVEETITSAIIISYDTATNGNKTRGGIKRAADILSSFSPHFPDSVSFARLTALISATHALSFYKLALQHGIPSTPVNIRAHPDPISLIEKVLQQNDKAYTQLDDLVRIAGDLCAAGFSSGVSSPASSDKDETALAAKRVLSLAVTAALDANDFETAYSFITTHVSIPWPLHPAESASNHTTDPLSWSIAYTAGRHPSSPTVPSSSSTQAHLNHLSRRLDLLSLALSLAPPANLSEVLAAWRRADEEAAVLWCQEDAVEEAVDAEGDAFTVPGGFGFGTKGKGKGKQGKRGSRFGFLIGGDGGGSGGNEDGRGRRTSAFARFPSLSGFGIGGGSNNNTSTSTSTNVTSTSAQQEKPTDSKTGREAEAPMGLFDVARGAARALRRNVGGVSVGGISGIPGIPGIPGLVPLAGAGADFKITPSSPSSGSSSFAAVGAPGTPSPPPDTSTRAAAPTSTTTPAAAAVAAASTTTPSPATTTTTPLPRPTGHPATGVGAGGSLQEKREQQQQRPHRPQRKRDMVSNVMTGGLVSGIGWVLGAQPVVDWDKDEGEGERERERGGDEHLNDKDKDEDKHKGEDEDEDEGPRGERRSGDDEGDPEMRHQSQVEGNGHGHGEGEDEGGEDGWGFEAWDDEGWEREGEGGGEGEREW